MSKYEENGVFHPNPRPLTTAILVLDDCNTLSFAAAVDPMRAANRRAGKPLFDWQFFTATGTPASLTSGLNINGPAIAKLTSCDLLLVVAGFRLEDHATPALLSSLRRIAGQGTSIAAIDGGPWLLARAGLLDGQIATTHWEDLEEFATRFPNVNTRRDRFCISGRFATSGGAAPCIDMMLYLIGTRFGKTLAQRVGSAFLYDPLPAGSQPLTSTPRKVRRNPRLARALERMEATISEPLPIPDIAAHAGLSVRALELRFQTHLGLSPKATYLQMRLEEALRLAQDTSYPVRDIALATGFISPASFARAFKEAHGQSVRSLRSQGS
ncbi:AraC family transcriptional regulator with amidase-like domain [Shimia isoporae]|uniref:AraC family transcriptional regulator with amidase-like domain n=1 Tax=Shimia isoporae TaxID=647720 RepID=A0A4R1NTN8_9RHOB|nr:GlxA family transcriptional regulator [Shimia isoporae]TCL10183.1 AraC family transcriptional regulator with amidase-like domain [Shimia isoporae]